MGKASKTRLLVIPHIYSDEIKIRSIELARNLTADFDVYCLRWNDLFFVHDKIVIKKWVKKIYFGLLNLFSFPRVAKGNDGLIYVNAPYLQPLLLEKCFGYKITWYVSRLFNTFILSMLVKWLKIETVLLASFAYRFPKSARLKKYFDVFDWFDESLFSQNVFDDFKEYMSYLKQSTSDVFVVSPDLGKKLGDEYNLKSISLPNGADVYELRNAVPSDVEDVRKRWGLEGKYVIGYIGNHGSFGRIDFVLEMFRELNKTMRDALLFVVGPVDYWAEVISKVKDNNVIFTGPINQKKISAYFNAIDLGLNAQEKSSGTEFAFQLKIVEYTACRKFVISTPLLVWQRLNWPNVVLCEMNINAWIEGITMARNSMWDKEWDKLVDPYDWKMLGKDLARKLGG